jgi:hypothetical protein
MSKSIVRKESGRNRMRYGIGRKQRPITPAEHNAEMDSRTGGAKIVAGLGERASGDYVLRFGMHAGKSLAQVKLEGDLNYLRWLAHVSEKTTSRVQRDILRFLANHESYPGDNPPFHAPPKPRRQKKKRKARRAPDQDSNERQNMAIAGKELDRQFGATCKPPWLG